jgi:NAD(P)-dependent dehydrogenase (short-subunit alcohol dehydrogenase family)
MADMPAPDRNKLIDPKTVDYDRLDNLRDQTFIVVGSGRGFGETTSRLLKHKGANVVCVDVDTERGAQVAQDLQSPLVVADVTEQRGVDEVVKVALREYGRIDGLIDVVGMGGAKPLSQYTLEDWEWDFRINLRHAFLLGKSICPIMADNGGGSMVFISSIWGWYASHTQPGYGPAKAALMIWIKQLAEEFGPQGVRVNCVAPGPFVTPKIVNEHLKDNTALYEALSQGPFLDRMGQPYEVAATAVFLLTRGAGYITGQTINVEGGAMSRNPLGFSQAHAATLSDVSQEYRR